MGTKKNIILTCKKAAAAGALIFIIQFSSLANPPSVQSDSIKSRWSLTYQPVLYIAPDAWALLYLTFNTEWDRKPEKPSFDLQVSYIYSKGKTKYYQYSLVEKQNLFFIEIGQRYYLRNKRHQKGSVNHQEGLPAPIRFPKTGFYFKPAITVILRYLHAEELNYTLNLKTDTKKLDAFGAVGLYMGYKAVNSDRVVLNPYLGLQFSNQSETNKIIMSPLLSGGIGLEF